jgi:hypothetical protein
MSDRAQHAPLMALDFDGWAAKLPDAERNTIQHQLSVAPDPEAEKRTLTNMFWLSERTGFPLRTVGNNYEAFRSGYGTREGWGDAWKDDATFHARIVSEAAAERDEDVMLRGYAGDTEESRKSRESSMAISARMAAIEGGSGDVGEAWVKWEQAAKATPAFRARNAANYYFEFSQHYAQGMEDRHAGFTAAEGIFPVLAGEVEGVNVAEALKFLRPLTKDQQDVAFMRIAELAKESPAKKPWADSAGEAITGGGRAIEAIVRGLSNQIESLGAGAGIGGEPEDVAADQLLLRRLVEAREGVVNPIKKDTFLKKALYGATESLPYMAAVAIPGGIFGVAGAYANDAELNLLEKGVPLDKARGLSAVIGPAQAALDRLQLGLLKKMPGLNTVLQKWNTNAIGLAAGRVAGVTGAETLIELGQDQLIPALVQDIASAWDAEVPGVKWADVGRDAWAQTPDTLLAMLPLALLGAGAAAARDIKGADALARSDAALKMLGFSPSQAAAIRMAPDGQAAAVLKELWNQRTPVLKGDSPGLSTGEAADVVGRKMAEDEEAAAAAPVPAEPISDTGTGAEGEPPTGLAGDLHATPDAGIEAAETEAELNAAAGIKALRRDDHGWTVVLENDERVAVGTAEAAQHLRASLFMAKTKQEADAFVQIADTFAEREKAKGVPSAQVFTGEAVRADEGGAAALSPAGKMRDLEMTTSSLAELGNQLRLLGVPAADIQGSNWVQEDLGKITYFSQVNQTREGVLTVVHERVESAYRRGVVKPDETRAAAKALLPVFAGDKSVGPALQRIAEGKASDTEARETMVDLVVADTLGQRKDGSRMPAGSITAGVRAAIARNMDKAEARALGRFRAFLRAMKAYMRALFSAAARLKKARREGMDIKEFEKFTDKLLGIDKDRQQVEAVKEELSDWIDPDAVDYKAPDGDAETEAFSLSPANLMERLAADIAGRIRSPKEKLAVFTQIQQRLNSMAQAIRFNDDIAGAVTRAEIEKERRERRTAREEELLNEVEADFGDLDGAEFISKAMNNPVMDAVFTQKPGEKFPRSMIQSRSRAERRGRDVGGSYDGAGELPRWVFGGKMEPDVLAQQLYEDGLLKEPTPDALWLEIGKALKSVAGARDRLAKYAERKREAREQATKEAKAWADEQLAGLADAQADRSKKDMIRWMAALDSLLVPLPVALRAKIGGFTRLASLQTNKARAAFIKDRIEKMERVMEDFLKKEYTERITALFDRANKKAREAGKKPESSIGADTHYLLGKMQEAMTMDEEKGLGELAGLEAKIASGTLTADQEALAMREIELVGLAGNWANLDAAERAAAYAAADETFHEGYFAWSKKIKAKREQRELDRMNLRIDSGKLGTKEERDARAKKDMGWKGAVKDVALSVSSFEEVVRYVFGEKSETGRALVDRERAASNAKEDEVQAVSDEVEDLFTELSGWPGKGRSAFRGTELRYRMAQPKIETERGGKLSELQAIQYVMMWNQPDGRRHMEAHGHNEAEAKMVFDALSDEARQVMQFLLQKYAAEYPAINALYRQRHGVNLPQHDNYAPLTVVPVMAREGGMVDPVTGAAMSGNAITPGSLRSRAKMATAEPDFRDALQTYLGHRRQLAHWKAYYDLSTDMQAILGHRDTGNVVEAKGGEEAVKVMRAWKDLFAQGGNRDAAAFLGLNKRLGKMASLASEMILVGRTGTLMIQSVQLGAALAEMPTGSYIKRLGMLFAGRLNWGDALRSDYIQRRYKTAPPIVRQALDALATAEPNRVKQAATRLGKLISGADAFFTSGTYAILLDYHRAAGAKMGMTGAKLDAYAHQQAERSTERVAQPVRQGTRSIFENLSTGPMVRIGWAFASEPRQKIALAAWALRNAKKNPARFARTAAVVWGAGGVMASLIRAAWRDMREDDDDEVFDDRNWNVKRLLVSSAAGPVQGIPGLGPLLEGIAFRTAGVYAPEGDIFSQAGRGVDSARKLASGTTLESDEPVEDTLKAAKGILFTMGLWNETIAAATSLSNVAEDAAKVVDNFDGDE